MTAYEPVDEIDHLTADDVAAVLALMFSDDALMFLDDISVEHVCVGHDEDVPWVHIETSEGSCFRVSVLRLEHDTGGAR